MLSPWLGFNRREYHDQRVPGFDITAERDEYFGSFVVQTTFTWISVRLLNRTSSILRYNAELSFGFMTRRASVFP